MQATDEAAAARRAARQSLAHVAAARLPAAAAAAAAAAGAAGDDASVLVGHAQAGVQALQHVLQVESTLSAPAALQLSFPGGHDAAAAAVSKQHSSNAHEEAEIQSKVEELSRRWQLITASLGGSAVLRKLLQVPVVQKHHSVEFVPQYVRSSSRAQCSRCRQVLPQWFISVHLCKAPVALSLEQQQQLAVARGLKSSWDQRRCPLCGVFVVKGQHACRHFLWQPLVVDLTAMTPGLGQANAANQARLVMRQGSLLPAVSALDMLPVRTVFPLPAAYVQQQQQQLETLKDIHAAQLPAEQLQPRFLVTLLKNPG
ncbi:hypothetical protein OEZ85_011085 [Tetradesmus obliquus]|uniref:Uncharacterized protein n=1 Tax=Tetradesmus obliquus TaxID=3088 RepID=A0ABY8TPE9_TETOB|nr:hypothetical protein OEZ85_011085 [Tetradesmus obliquus]